MVDVTTLICVIFAAMKKIIPFILVIAIQFACSQKKDKAGSIPQHRTTPPVSVEGFIVRIRALSENIEVAGSVLPAEETEIKPEISGRLVSIHFHEGSFVRKGALLAKLYDGDLQAQLKKLEVQLEINQKTVERYKELLKIQGISQQDVDLSELQVSNIKADIELVKVSIGKTEIRAPFDGNIGLRNVSIGAYVSPTTVIATLRQLNELKLEFTVPEKYSAEFKKGKIVSFGIEGVKEKFNAVVMASELSIDANTRSLKIKALVRGGNPALVPGSFAKVALHVDQNNEALIVPTQAVIPMARGKQVIVYKAGIPNFQNVTTGIRDSAYVQISDGLHQGDTVLVTGLMTIRPDSKLQLTKVQ
jgi:membrane fusion protein (multidrug efflux system)